MAARSGAQPSALSSLRPLTSLVGREDAIDSIVSLLSSHRLVTLLGTGGSGKTRLAIEVATRLEDAFADGAGFADLAPLVSDDRVANVVGSALGVPEVAPTAVIDSIAGSLAERRCLLVVDNCERVVDGCALLVHALLVRCPGLVVLATSRTPLGIDGELTWMVPSLSLPPRPTDDPVLALHSSESGQLLLDRSQVADGAIAASASALIDICHKLDGVPLALELAATRIRALGAEEVRRGLKHRFSLLTSNSRLVPPRQRTLEASIDWSYGLLSEPEQLLFRRLAVFAGPFDVGDAEAVCAADGVVPREVRPLLAGLVDHSLVWTEPDPQRPRYRLPDTTRHFAADRLRDSGEDGDIQDCHLRHMLDVAESLDRAAVTNDIETVAAGIDTRIDGIRAALDWAIRSNQITEGLRLAARLRPVWIFQNRIREGLDHLTNLLDADPADGPVDPAVRITALLATAHLYVYADDVSGRDLVLADEAVALARSSGDGNAEARALVFSAWPNVFVDPADARSRFAEALQAARVCDDDREFANASWGLAWTATTTGDLVTAVDVADAGLERARAQGSFGVRYGLTFRGYAAILQADFVRADEYLAEAADLFPPGADRFNADRVSMWQGTSAMYQGRYDEASELLEAAVNSAAEVGNPPMFGPLQLGLLRWSTGDEDRAVPLLEGALEVFAEMGNPIWFRTQALAALADLAAGPDDRRRRLHDLALAVDGSHNDLARAVATLAEARAHVTAGDHEKAANVAMDALHRAHDIGYRLGVIDATDLLALVPGPDQARWLAAVENERARCGYARFPIHESSYQTAVESAGELRTPVSLNDLLAVPPSRVSTDRPATGWASLTPAELRVADLVAEGLTNPEVGEKLFISRRTVQAHLSHIYDKLGIANRAELASLVARHSLVDGGESVP